ncbi:Rne/Rng family ribonuclease [Desulforegula conservatrix]|uniref:Rne/Rng family ribonuclease n=1 Tax=Desulforegula conservatrix TaxID=153026 RepID=UPI000407219B|nr:Rne/Rng family ribonuclease [Desulforegula conservatrix]
MKELIINVIESETRVALVENGTIAELFIERGDESNIAGNIYKGRVQRVLPGMQAAFVDIGLRQAAFLYVDDVLGAPRSNFDDQGEEVLSFDEEAAKCAKTKECRIEDLLLEGQEIMVQVAKSPIETKGARVTTHISLPGRFLVLMPTVDHIGISRRIEDDDERSRLREMIISMREKNLGYIFRTAAEAINEEIMAREMGFLNSIWDKIQKKYSKAPAPSLLHMDLTVTLRAVRDLLTHEADRVVVDSMAGYDLIDSFLKKIVPGHSIQLEYYDGKEPIFEAYNLEGDISRAMKRKVWLKSGGYIIIEHTEALVAIDVNTGRYVGKQNFEETVLKTNLEAVKEIAYQVRLRNLGGIIIVDFIDMESLVNREKVYAAVKDAMKNDKNKTNILPMSDMGIIQMTRKRVRKSLNRMLREPCSYCDGSGYHLSRQTICYKIYRDVIKHSGDFRGKKFTVRVHPDVAEMLHGEEREVVSNLERKLGLKVEIYPEKVFHIENYEIIESMLE